MVSFFALSGEGINLFPLIQQRILAPTAYRSVHGPKALDVYCSTGEKPVVRTFVCGVFFCGLECVAFWVVLVVGLV